jgi:hypothetical protein
MRLTIGRKIFAVAGFLLVLMAAAAVLSTWKVRQASNEIHAVARYFVPLADRIAEIQAGVLQQEVIVQRIVRDFALQDADPQAIEEHIAAFEGGGRLIDEAIDQAILLTEEAIEEAPYRQADIEMSRSARCCRGWSAATTTFAISSFVPSMPIGPASLPPSMR